MRTSALFGAKYYGFIEVYGVFAQTRGVGGWTSADILRTRGGINISRFCADIFYGRPLRKTFSAWKKAILQYGDKFYSGRT